MIQDGHHDNHLGFQIGSILAVFDLLAIVALMLSAKVSHQPIDQTFREKKKFKISFLLQHKNMRRVTLDNFIVILDFSLELFELVLIY